MTLGVRSALVSSDQAQVSYAVPRAGRVRLELFNARGARVATLLDGASDAGTQVLDWSAGSPAPFPQNGVYFLRLTAEGGRRRELIFARGNGNLSGQGVPVEWLALTRDVERLKEHDWKSCRR